MKILIISHAYVEEDNRKKLAVLSSYPDLDIGVLSPEKWRTWHGEEKRNNDTQKQKPYREFSANTYFSTDAGRYFYNPLSLVGLLIRYRPDLVHLEEEPFTPVASEVAFFCLILRLRLVFFSWENINLPLGFFRRIFEKFVLLVSQKAIAGNSGAVVRLKNRGFTRGIKVIPQFGVDLDSFKKFRELSEKNVFVVGFVGRFSEAKGLSTLLEAFRRLPSTYRLLAVTTSPSVPDWLLGLADNLGVRERIEFKVSVVHSDLPAYFNQMDVFVLPSRTTETWKEQFGRTLIEAMACGVTVIGSSSGAIPEVIGEAGLIFKEGDVDDLFSKIIEAGDPERRRELSRAGLNRVSQKFSFDKICQETHDFYRLLL